MNVYTCDPNEEWAYSGKVPSRNTTAEISYDLNQYLLHVADIAAGNLNSDIFRLLHLLFHAVLCSISIMCHFHLLGANETNLLRKSYG